MPSYVTVETYLPCSDGELASLVARFRGLLDELGYTGHDNEFWQEAMGWDDEDWWSGPTAHRPCPVRGLTVAGKELWARANVLGWSRPTMPGLTGHWLSFELGFETEGEYQCLVTTSAFDPKVGTYIPGVGRALWHVMRAFADEFKGNPVYCSFEGFEGDAFEALVTGTGKLWSFDAALVPLALAPRYSPVSAGYEMEEVAEGVALADRSAWVTLPWRELE